MSEQPRLDREQGPPDLFNGHTLPFLVFIGLTSLTGLIPGGTYVFYPLKTLVGLGMLWYYRREYTELKSWRFHWSAVPVGLAVLALWIGLDFLTPGTGGFNPFTTGNQTTNALMAAVRLGGSALVVPILEELFWRSWLVRYLIDRDDYRRVPVGQFTWASFLIMIVLFGLEHDRWFAGMVAGACYGALVYQHKEIRTAIVAHGLTNLGLGAYVIFTGSWHFW